MDHNANMSGMEPGGHADHAHPHAGEDGMGMAMSMVFNTSTKVTLFFSSWSTTTVTSYVFTLIFLFALAVFNRFLGALKFQLDMRRTEPASSLSPVPKLDLPTARRRRNPPPKDRVSPLPRYLDVNGDNTEHDGPLPSAPFLGSDSERTWDGLYSSQTEESQDLTARFGSWSSRGHWSWRQDGTSSLLEGVRALVGYALMLAVMTFNVGVFCAVLGGIVLGELFLGRYAQPSSGWQDGACHD